MELIYISQKTANLIMDAMMCAWMELVAEGDEDRIEEGEDWTRNSFIRFCDAAGIVLIEK